jgi:hypothetical protein
MGRKWIVAHQHRPQKTEIRLDLRGPSGLAVGEDHDAVADRLDRRQREPHRAHEAREQLLTAAEHDREDHKTRLVEQSLGEQAAHERPRAGDQDVAVVTAPDGAMSAPRFPLRIVELFQSAR